MALPTIPRITIGAFCETQECADFLAEVSRETSMSRASMEIAGGGISGAVNFYKTGGQKTPSLLILEVPDATEDTLTTLDKLAEICDSDTKVIVIGHKNDVKLYRDLIERGVSDYVAAPDETMDVINSIARIYSPQTYKASGNLTAVFGVRGGVGASTLAHNIAWMIASRLNQATILADMDINFGTVSLNFNRKSNHSIIDALYPESKLDSTMLERLLVKTDNPLSLLLSPASLQHTMDFQENLFDEIIGFLRSLAPYVVLDLPHVWTNWMKSVLGVVDSIILVAEPDLTSLRNTKMLFDNLRTMRGVQTTPPIIMLNRFGIERRPETLQPDFEETLGHKIDYIIADDPELFGNAANNGYIFCSANPNHVTTKKLASLIHKITNTHNSEAKVEEPSVIQKILGMIGK